MGAELIKPSWWEKREDDLSESERAELSAWLLATEQRQEAERVEIIESLRSLARTLNYFRFEIEAAALAFEEGVPSHLYRALWEDQAEDLKAQDEAWQEDQELVLYHAWKARLEADQKNFPK